MKLLFEQLVFFSLDESLIKRTDSTQFKQPARRPLKTGFNIDKAKNELGYKPHTFEEGLSLLQKQLQ
jgi:dTDP-4-dehydrorhamnose reductase